MLNIHCAKKEKEKLSEEQENSGYCTMSKQCIFYLVLHAPYLVVSSTLFCLPDKEPESRGY